VYLAVGILAWGSTLAAAGLLAGSVLGTLVLGWLAWEFWTHW